MSKLYKYEVPLKMTYKVFSITEFSSKLLFSYNICDFSRHGQSLTFCKYNLQCKKRHTLHKADLKQ